MLIWNFEFTTLLAEIMHINKWSTTSLIYVNSVYKWQYLKESRKCIPSVSCYFIEGKKCYSAVLISNRTCYRSQWPSCLSAVAPAGVQSVLHSTRSKPHCSRLAKGLGKEAGYEVYLKNSSEMAAKCLIMRYSTGRQYANRKKHKDHLNNSVVPELESSSSCSQDHHRSLSWNRINPLHTPQRISLRSIVIPVFWVVFFFGFPPSKKNCTLFSALPCLSHAPPTSFALTWYA
jgi:hypothetical protein